MVNTADPSLRLNLKAHAKEVTALKFRNDEHLISCSNDHNVVSWHLNTPDVRTYKFAGHTAEINDIDCSSNGRLIASASQDKTIRIWVPTLKGGTRDIRAHMKPITTVQFSPTGKKLLTGSIDKCLKYWDVTTSKFLHSMVGHNHYVNCARFTSDGKVAVSCGEDKSIKIWDVESRQCIHTFTNTRASANKIAIYGRYIACAFQSSSVRIYDYMERKLVQHYVLHENIQTTCVDWHPTGKYLLAAATNGLTSIIDIMEGRPIYQLQGLGGAITSVAFSPKGDSFACGGANRHILVWDWNVSSNDISPSGSSPM